MLARLNRRVVNRFLYKTTRIFDWTRNKYYKYPQAFPFLFGNDQLTNFHNLSHGKNTSLDFSHKLYSYLRQSQYGSAGITNFFFPLPINQQPHVSFKKNFKWFRIFNKLSRQRKTIHKFFQMFHNLCLVFPTVLLFNVNRFNSLLYNTFGREGYKAKSISSLLALSYPPVSFISRHTAPLQV